MNSVADSPSAALRPNYVRERELASSTPFQLADIEAVFDTSAVTPELTEKFIRSAAALDIPSLDASCVAGFFEKGAV